MKHLLLFLPLVLLLSCSQESDLQPKQASDFSKAASAESGVPCGSVTSFKLLAGQTIESGAVTIFNDAKNLYVTYSTSNGWSLSEVHLYVGSKAGLPVNKAGNPMIGNFPHKANFTSISESYTFSFDLGSLNLKTDDCIIIAAHAVVKKTDKTGAIIATETAWAEGIRLSKGSWATYGNYCVQACEAEKECIAQSETAWSFGTPFGTERWGWYSSYSVKSTSAITSFDLFGGKTILVGKLEAYNDSKNLYISYKTNGDWLFEETHLYVGSLDKLPVNSQGVPAPGQFPLNQNHSPFIGTVNYTIPLSSLGSEFIVAAHSEVNLMHICPESTY